MKIIIGISITIGFFIAYVIWQERKTKIKRENENKQMLQLRSDNIKYIVDLLDELNIKYQRKIPSKKMEGDIPGTGLILYFNGLNLSIYIIDHTDLIHLEYEKNICSQYINSKSGNEKIIHFLKENFLQ